MNEAQEMNEPVRIKGYDEIIEALDDAKKIAGYLSDAYVNTMEDRDSWKKGCEDANRISQRFDAENVKLRARLAELEAAVEQKLDAEYRRGVEDAACVVGTYACFDDRVMVSQRVMSLLSPTRCGRCRDGRAYLPIKDPQGPGVWVNCPECGGAGTHSP